MRVFLTGATGYIGSAVREALVRAGHDVTALVRSAAKGKRLTQQGVKVIVGDLGDPSTYRDQAEGFDAYVHTAYDPSPRGPEIDRKTIETLRDRAWRSSRSVLIYTSAVWVLGSSREPVDETAPVNPTPLVAFRPAHESLVLDANGGGLRAIVVRPGIVYGGAHGIIAEMLRDADNGIMRVIGNGENHWPLIYDRDLADLYVKLVSHREAAGIFHATEDAEERVIDLVKAMSRHVEFTPEVRYMPIAEARTKLGSYADVLALDQIVRSPRAREVGWSPSLKSVGGNVPRLLEEWRNGR